jgi:hypothetical protein
MARLPIALTIADRFILHADGNAKATVDDHSEMIMGERHVDQHPS